MDGGNNTQQSYQGPPEWLQNEARGYLGQARGVAELPYESYGMPRVAGLSPLTQAGMRGIGSLGGGTNYTDAAGANLTETLSGGGMNPFMGGISDRILTDARRNYDDATGAITRRFNTGYGNAGGAAHMAAQQRADEAFARGSTDALSQAYAQMYEGERNRQMQASSLAGGLYDTLGRGYQNMIGAGDLDRQSQQRYMDSLYGDFNEWRSYPQQQLSIYGGALGNVLGNHGGGQTATTTGPGADPISQGIGAMMLGRSVKDLK